MAPGALFTFQRVKPAHGSRFSIHSNGGIARQQSVTRWEQRGTNFKQTALFQLLPNTFLPGFPICFTFFLSCYSLFWPVSACTTVFVPAYSRLFKLLSIFRLVPACSKLFHFCSSLFLLGSCCFSVFQVVPCLSTFFHIVPPCSALTKECRNTKTGHTRECLLTAATVAHNAGGALLQNDRLSISCCNRPLQKAFMHTYNSPSVLP